MFDVLRDEIRSIENELEDQRHDYLTRISDAEEERDAAIDERDEAIQERDELATQVRLLSDALNTSSDIIERQGRVIAELENELQGS